MSEAEISQKQASKSERLSNRILGLYSLPAVPLAALGLPIVVFLPPYYHEFVGLELGVVGLVFMLGRFWDIFTDPIAGIIEDRTKIKFGRRRFWLLVSAPFTAVAAYFLFFPPQTAGVVYLMLSMFALYVGYTLSQVAHLSWGAELSRDYIERARVQGWREFAVVAGMMSVLAAPALIVMSGMGDFGTAVQTMGLFIIIGFPLASALTVFTVPEPELSQASDFKWTTAFHLLMSNSQLRFVLLMDILMGFGAGVLGSLFRFYFLSIHDMGSFSNVLMMMYFLSGLVCVPLWIWIAKRFGKAKAFRLAMGFSAVTTLLFFFIPAGNIPAAFALVALGGSAYGAGPFLIRAFTADLNEVDFRESSDSKAGIYYGLLLMSSKLGLALSVGVTYLILGWAGFDAKLASDNSTSALTILQVTYLALPALAFGGAMLLIAKYTLDDKLQEESETS